MASGSWSDVQILQKSFLFVVNSVFTTALKLIPKSLVNEPRKQQKRHGQTVLEPIGIKSITYQHILPSGQHTRLLLTTRNFNSLTARFTSKTPCSLISTPGRLLLLLKSTSIRLLSISLSAICFSILMTKAESHSKLH